MMLDEIVSGNISMCLFLPVLKRYWKQHELWDGTYTLSDLMDILEAIQIKDANRDIVIQHEVEKLGIK